MRIIRVYHAAPGQGQRGRERALADIGQEVVLVVPRIRDRETSDAVAEGDIKVVELPVVRPGDVNRHRYSTQDTLARLIREVEPDILDLHEEPFSAVSQQWLHAAPAELPVVMYTAQNIDKRFPPPFSIYEIQSFNRASALYPCSRQAASVARGKGFPGLIDVLPIGFDPVVFTAGEQSSEAEEVVLAYVGRLVPEKGVADAVRIFEAVNAARPARMIVAGEGPEAADVRALAERLGVSDRVVIQPWRGSAELAAIYRAAHVVVVPSRPTATWTEQFGRVIVEAQASGALVAGFASGAIPEIGGAALLSTPVGADEQLAKAIVSVLADPEEFGRRRAAGLDASGLRTWPAVAERHAALYARVLDGSIARVRLPRSPRRRRAVARAEFGATAPAAGGVRPFALPVLRRGGVAPMALAWSIDASAEMLAALRDRIP